MLILPSASAFVTRSSWPGSSSSSTDRMWVSTLEKPAFDRIAEASASWANAMRTRPESSRTSEAMPRMLTFFSENSVARRLSAPGLFGMNTLNCFIFSTFTSLS